MHITRTFLLMQILYDDEASEHHHTFAKSEIYIFLNKTGIAVVET